MRIEDDEPPIKTKHASKEYRDNWERIFGTDEACEVTPDIIEAVLADDDYIYLAPEEAVPEPFWQETGNGKPFPTTCEKCNRTIDDCNINWNAPREPACVVCAYPRSYPMKETP